MVKYIFGATSSPSCANFCLKKTALTYGKEFDQEEAETVDRNMYVDDLMEPVDNTERAIKLVKNLRELLKKGGFRLTKWLSTNREVLAEIPERERGSERERAREREREREGERERERERHADGVSPRSLKGLYGKSVVKR